MPHLDASDITAAVGLILLCAGLIWVHPGLLVATVGAGLLARAVRET